MKESIDKFLQYATEEGFSVAIQAITAGQYVDSKSIGYGGNQASWSNITLIHIVRSNLNLLIKLLV